MRSHRSNVIRPNNVKTPTVYYAETHMVGLERADISALIAPARTSTPTDSALVTLLALLGLLVSEACNVDINDCAQNEDLLPIERAPM